MWGYGNRRSAVFGCQVPVIGNLLDTRSPELNALTGGNLIQRICRSKTSIETKLSHIASSLRMKLLLGACSYQPDDLTSGGSFVQSVVGKCRRAVNCAYDLGREDDAQIAACTRRQRKGAGAVGGCTRSRHLKKILSHDEAGRNGIQRLVGNILNSD